MASETCLDGGLQPIILCSGMGPNPTQAEHTRLGSIVGATNQMKQELQLMALEVIMNYTKMKHQPI